MAAKHVITEGYGFASGTKFIPTMGYTPSSVVVPPVVVVPHDGGYQSAVEKERMRKFLQDKQVVTPEVMLDEWAALLALRIV